MTVETKYNQEETLWYIKNNKTTASTPRGFKVDCTYHGGSGHWGDEKTFPIIISYLMDEEWILESKLFKTKEELLKSL